MEGHDGHRHTGVAAETRAGQLADPPATMTAVDVLAFARPKLLLDIALARPDPRRYADDGVPVDGRLTQTPAPLAPPRSALARHENSPPRSPASRHAPSEQLT
jgi:hypothetical protein